MGNLGKERPHQEPTTRGKPPAVGNAGRQAGVYSNVRHGKNVLTRKVAICCLRTEELGQ
jgi:hypothetical protein